MDGCWVGGKAGGSGGKKRRRRTRKESTVAFSQNFAPYNSGSQFYTFKTRLGGRKEFLQGKEKKKKEKTDRERERICPSEVLLGSAS